MKVSESGQKAAKEALKLKGWNQQQLADSAECSRSTVSSFLNQKSVSASSFQGLCAQLGLKMSDVAKLENDASLRRDSTETDIDDLVESIRDQVRDGITQQCGHMRVLDMSQPIGLGDIYTKVNILEKITGSQRLSIDELLKRSEIEDFERFSLGRVTTERVPGIEAVSQHDKLMILGKPGAGKSTFLKHLAIQCIKGNFRTDLIPIFVTLKDFAEASGEQSLLAYLIRRFADFGVRSVQDRDAETFDGRRPTSVERCLANGKMLVLLDGLDEVRKADNDWVVREIQQFTSRFSQNSFVITCRIAARDYTFSQFIEVEIADFDDKQIEIFVSKWFECRQDTKKARTLLKKLEREKGIRDLASSPILLTLLCLVFGEAGNFPLNRSELYKEGIDVLLKKWDAKRNIERDLVYKKLSLRRKEDLLSQIAIQTFESGNYFFKQKEVEKEIGTYIRNLPGASTDEETLVLDSEAVLKSVEAQHGLLIERARGIYSFSHLTFHEYFTARKLAMSSKANIYQVQLLPNLTERRWREVFLLTIGMVDKADVLLRDMKREIDAMVSQDTKIQSFLTWVSEKTCAVNVSYKLPAIRSFYFSLDIVIGQDSSRSLARSLDRALDRSLDTASALDADRLRTFAHSLGIEIVIALDLDYSSEIDRSLDHFLEIDRSLNRSFQFARRARSFPLPGYLEIPLALERVCQLTQDSELEKALRLLLGQLPNVSNRNVRSWKSWFETEASAWTKQLRSVMMQYRNIGHDWQFSDEQLSLLVQYYEANKLLVNCLNSDCYVSREVRLEIEEGLLLPWQS